jgi:hypothetical protein
VEVFPNESAIAPFIPSHVMDHKYTLKCREMQQKDQKQGERLRNSTAKSTFWKELKMAVQHCHL